MRSVRFGVGVVLLFAVVFGVEASDQGDLLTRFWQEQQQTVQPTVMGEATQTKALIGIEFGTTERELLAKAAPDECYSEIGGPRTAPPCADDTRPKVNEGYVWSMVDAGTDIWFGTVANTQCIIMSTLIGQALGGTLPPHESNAWVCEFGDDTYDPFDDQRPPKIYIHHTTTGVLEDKTSALDAAGTTLLAEVIGLRAAGTHNGFVIFAGPTVDGDVHLFAFSTDGTYIDSAEAAWTDVRRFANFGDSLYVGVGVPEALPNPIGGEVLRWIGDSSDPFQFETVTYLPGEPVAELVVHDGRLIAGTWGNPQVLFALGETSGVWVSPDPVDGVLDAADGEWSKIWQVGDYDPDPLNAVVSGVGAMASYGGNLFWGTMHPPLLATAAHMNFYSDFYDDIDSAGYIEEFMLAAFLGTHRATSFWTAGDVTTTPAIDLLYGLPELPVFTEAPVGTDPLVEDYWQIAYTGWEPEWGISGFGNLFNCYTWSATVNNGRLWVGTMDWTYLLMDPGMSIFEAFLESEGITFDIFLQTIAEETGMPEFLAQFIDALWNAEEMATTAGADLYYFPFPDAPAFPESISGIDNYTSYGVRNMLSLDGSVYAGMANPMNLLTDTADDVPEGGWELIRLDDEDINTPVAAETTAVLDDGTRVTLCDVLDPGYTVGVWLPMPGIEFVLEPPVWRESANQVLLVGTSANAGLCSPEVLASVCMPITEETERLFQLQFVDDPVNGIVPGWVDITTGYESGMVCGDINPAFQPLLWDLGYYGYMGMVTPMALGDYPIPATTPWGRFLLIVLIGVAALVVIRLRF